MSATMIRLAVMSHTFQPTERVRIVAKHFPPITDESLFDGSRVDDDGTTRSRFTFDIEFADTPGIKRMRADYDWDRRCWDEYGISCDIQFPRELIDEVLSLIEKESPYRVD